VAERTDVAIVGGGPAGAALAIRLAGRGVATTLVERSAAPAWRACGVFSSPVTRRSLAALGLSEAQLGELSRPIDALELETTRGVRCRLEYRHGHALGFDRPALDAALLERAHAAGAELRLASVVESVSLAGPSRPDAELTIAHTAAGGAGEPGRLKARVVVGADGRSASVARAANVLARPSWLSRAGLTFHRADPAAAPAAMPMSGRFVFGDGWYVGIAPVPGRRVNVGMVVPSARLGDGPELTSRRLLEAFPGPSEPWMSAPSTDRLMVCAQLRQRVSRAAGEGWLLIGDAAGFVDPLTGDGLNHAFVSAALAAEAIERYLAGEHRALADYDRHLRARYRGRDALSWLLQLFLARPRAFDHALRRLDRRADLRAELTLVLADQARASRALDPRFMARLLAP
jgi:flavin-dependent dehydrogenase